MRSYSTKGKGLTPTSKEACLRWRAIRAIFMVHPPVKGGEAIDICNLPEVESMATLSGKAAPDSEPLPRGSRTVSLETEVAQSVEKQRVPWSV